ncbi:RNase H family protein [Confluentibacter citreus]|uniref:RNase H family protein n=1 Tax=Confluentibacter citreus TaxID=2007307 RepID=UPI000C292C99|nr:RNase H family protein [Confluentibacter citreus]
MKDVKIFVYGSCHFSERLDSDEAVGNGGYGVVISVNGKRLEEFSGGFSNTTNARMDIVGITEGLKKIKEQSEIKVYLSNGYVIDTLTKGWLEKWKKDGFKKKKHVDLWIELDKILTSNSHSISFLHSRDIKHSNDFQQAETLGKTMSGKKNLPNDLKNNNETDLFAVKTDNTTANKELEIVDDKPILESICVDASTIRNPGPTEYRGVDTKTKKLIFELKLDEATNNIGEFLAIVHALALYKKKQQELKIIYSDSMNAISWVKQKKCKTKYEKTDKNEKVFDLITRAETWLQNNNYNTKILKWNTGAWGEIPADYGRK